MTAQKSIFVLFSAKAIFWHSNKPSSQNLDLFPFVFGYVIDTYQTYIFIHFSIINIKYLVQAFYLSIITYCKRKYFAQNIFCVAYHACWPTDTQECTDCMDLLIKRLTALTNRHLSMQTAYISRHKCLLYIVIFALTCILFM